MGRKRDAIQKETVTIRLTPEARQLVKEIKEHRARVSGWSGAGRQYTNSIVIEQAIGQYYKIWEANVKFEAKVCGYCGQNRD